jgi:membrane protease YdiL (CAAX protease family)
MLSYIITYGSIFFYYSLFFLAITIGYKNGSGQFKDVLSGKGEPGTLMARLVAGIFFLGLGSAILFVKRNVDSGIITPDWDKYDLIVWVLIALAVIVGTLSALKQLFTTNIFNDPLPFSLPLSFLFVRTLFLIVYEFFFRGAVLFIMIEDVGVVTAVIANLILYVLVHWFDKKERYGSVLMGIVLCSVSIYYHSVWPAIIIHLSLALSHEVTLLIKNKSLIKKSWS